MVQNLGKKIQFCLYDQTFQTFSNLNLFNMVGLIYAETLQLFKLIRYKEFQIIN